MFLARKLLFEPHRAIADLCQSPILRIDPPHRHRLSAGGQGSQASELNSVRALQDRDWGEPAPVDSILIALENGALGGFTRRRAFKFKIDQILPKRFQN